MAEIETGVTAPDFDLPVDGGERVALSSLSGRNLVLYFYPKADTPGCTTEGQDFSALIDEFGQLNAPVIGVSRDPVRKLDRFKAKYDLKVILGSDEDGAVCEAYGVWVEKTLYGRKYMGVERATFLIDDTGVTRRIWRNVKVKGHAAEVLDALKAL